VNNDPIIGQGLSTTLRDVRMVRDALLETSDWTDSALFEPYAEERRERMRRLRFVARFVTELFARFGDEAEERRKRALTRIRAEPPPILVSVYVGVMSQNWIVASLTLLRGSSGSEVRRVFHAARGDRGGRWRPR
jgi:2-polyprenyl-6-methoxyphenol hydroxylase-like FAD-dependent oxidoreductase